MVCPTRRSLPRTPPATLVGRASGHVRHEDRDTNFDVLATVSGLLAPKAPPGPFFRPPVSTDRLRRDGRGMEGERGR